MLWEIKGKSSLFLSRSLAVSLWHAHQQWRMCYIGLAHSICLSLPYWSAATEPRLGKHAEKSAAATMGSKNHSGEEATVKAEAGALERHSSLLKRSKGSSTQNSFARRGRKRENDRCGERGKEPKSPKDLGRMKGKTELEGSKGE